MKRHPRVVAAVVVIAAITVVSACAPEEAPKPTPTAAFASDEEAFAAAEETYRAYVDALNQVDLSDPDTFESVYALTTGEVNSSDRATFSQMHAANWTVTGASKVDDVALHEFEAESLTVFIDICLNVGEVELTGPDGASMVDGDRTDLQAIRGELALDSPAERLLIANLTARDDGLPCV